MKATNDINVRIFRVKGDEAPFLRVDYVDKDNIEQKGLLLLDSCSCDVSHQ